MSASSSLGMFEAADSEEYVCVGLGVDFHNYAWTVIVVWIKYIASELSSACAVSLALRCTSLALLDGFADGLLYFFMSLARMD